MRLAHRLQDRPAATVGHVHVEEHHVGLEGGDRGHRLADGTGLAHDVDVGAQLRADARAEHRVVVDQEHPQARLLIHDVLSPPRSA